MAEAKTPGFDNQKVSAASGVSKRLRLERLQVCVSKDILERCWDIASIDRVTVASLVEEALAREIDRREDVRGEPYPERRNGVQSGPVSRPATP